MKPESKQSNTASQGLKTITFTGVNGKALTIMFNEAQFCTFILEEGRSSIPRKNDIVERTRVNIAREMKELGFRRARDKNNSMGLHSMSGEHGVRINIVQEYLEERCGIKRLPKKYWPDRWSSSTELASARLDYMDVVNLQMPRVIIVRDEEGAYEICEDKVAMQSLKLAHNLNDVRAAFVSAEREVNIHDPEVFRQRSIEATEKACQQVEKEASVEIQKLAKLIPF